ncbi:MAG: hypothetical protein Kow0089_23950 [Desulfobulbaceae bacterium]
MSRGRHTHTASRWQPSLRGYLLLIIVVLLCLLFPAISIFYYQQTATFRDEQLRRTVEQRTAMLRSKAAQLARSIAYSGTQAIAGYNFTLLNDLIKKAVSEDPEFVGCQVVSAMSGEETIGYGSMGLDRKYYADAKDEPGSGVSPFPEEEDEKRLPPVVFVDLERAEQLNGHAGLMAIAPVYVGGRLWGTVNAVFSLEKVDNDILRIRNEWATQMSAYKNSFLTISVIFVFLGVLSSVLLSRPLLRSIDRLREGVDRVSSGDLEHEIYFSGLSCEEFVGLSRAFNEMTENLRLAKRKLDEYSRSLEDLVAERTRELEETQRELVAKAHEAGMAEMAVGVLHNIGNAITPVKVSTATLVNHLRESPLRTSLSAVIDQSLDKIRKAEDLPAEDKNRIVEILELLPEGIQEEYDQIIKEIELISDKHKYIENVINLQMHYARLKGRAELVDINRVVKDALEMLAEVIDKHGIEVETNFQKVDMVRLEEGKLLQIMVNLIKNGCEAMEGKGAGAKKLTIATGQREGESPVVFLTVKDTGCGFTPEESKKFLALQQNLWVNFGVGRSPSE